ncbi:hypothetical protein V2J52_14845 [Georgenia sp. MJ173]|uniref:ABC transporter permease n=1 Tax=Georgenia sunbinii TaxID=3117728 RepID=UPI002F267232
MASTLDTRTSRPPVRGGSEDSGPRAGTTVMVRFMLRRDRVKLPAWIAGLGVFVVYIGAALPQLAPTEEDLAAVAPLVQQPVGRMFTGPGYGMDAPTYENFFAAGYAPYLFLLAALMNIMLVTRHTRLEEQTGRAELVRANVTGRQTMLTAALVVAAIGNAAVAVVVTALAIANGFAATGSLLIGCGAGLVGMAFAGLTAVTAQLSENSRGVAGLAGIVLGVAYLLRAVGDMAELGGSALSWASPLGWASQTAPYVLDRWWPLLPLAALAIVGVVLAFVLQGRRDLGAGLLSARPGRATARPSLGTPLGLAARLQRGAFLGWGVAVLAFGVVDGAFAQVMLDADMPPAVGEIFGGEVGMLGGYLAFLATFNGYLTAAYTVFAVQSLRAEESHGRAEQVLATPTARATWAGAHLLVVALGAAVILVVGGVGTALAVAAVTGESGIIGDVVLAHVNMLPGVLVVLGLSALLFGWLPRLMAPVGWALVGVIVFVGNFAGLLDLPPWLANISPLSHPAQVPLEDVALIPLLVLLGLAAALAGLGLLGLRRRQIETR